MLGSALCQDRRFLALPVDLLQHYCLNVCWNFNCGMVETTLDNDSPCGASRQGALSRCGTCQSF